MVRFKELENYPGYLIGCNGQVISLRRKQPKLLIPQLDHRGYHTFHIGTKENGLKILKAHRLVAEAFIENILDEKEVNHKDGNKLNNCKVNLEWCNRLHNMKHAFKTGLAKHYPGSRNYNAKLSEEDIYNIRTFKDDFETCKELGLKYNVTPGHINNILKRRVWKHI